MEPGTAQVLCPPVTIGAVFAIIPSGILVALTYLYGEECWLEAEPPSFTAWAVPLAFKNFVLFMISFPIVYVFRFLEDDDDLREEEAKTKEIRWRVFFLICFLFSLIWLILGAVQTVRYDSLCEWYVSAVAFGVSVLDICLIIVEFFIRKLCDCWGPPEE